MDLTHQFTVPAAIEETWTRFQDIAGLAECFPGAQVTSFDGDGFEGTVKVKLGPISLTYAGSGTFIEKDEDAHRLVLEAKGRDKRGNGTAGATATISMTATDGGTAVEVHTDLSITGKPAQFGRGVIQDVSDKLLGQFVACLEEKSRATPGGAAESEAESAAEPAADLAVDQRPTGSSASPSSAERSTTPGRTDEALDLGAAVLPVLAKTYARQIVAGLVGVLALIFVIRRARR